MGRERGLTRQVVDCAVSGKHLFLLHPCIIVFVICSIQCRVI